MNEHTLGLAAGLTVGLAVGLLVVALLFKLKVMDLTFDERQERARGQAYKYGFFTLVACMFVYGLSELFLGHWCDVLAGCTICICLGVCVFAVACIRKDAYLSLYEKPKTVMILFAVIAIFNLALGVSHSLDGTLVENGTLTFRACNPICGLMILIIMVFYAVRLFKNRVSEEAE